MRKIYLKTATVVLSLALLFSNCASIVSKSNYPISIRTDPAGATVSITDKKGKEIFRGTSPATVTVKSGAGFFSKAEYQVRLSSPGFAEKIVPINFKLNGWYWGNIFFGGFVGMLIIDPATGAMWRVVDPVVYETLTKSTAVTKEPTLKIMSIAEVPENLKSKLVSIK
ncbi:MAG TPA: PEGA domain-containing protein [Segetibacter sp.]|jgi:hypothetical protein